MFSYVHDPSPLYVLRTIVKQDHSPCILWLSFPVEVFCTVQVTGMSEGEHLDIMQCLAALCRQDVRQMSLLGSRLNDKESWLANLGYLYPIGQEDSITAITHWICIDPDSHVSAAHWSHRALSSYWLSHNYIIATGLS